jgi:hypothetical protein
MVPAECVIQCRYRPSKIEGGNALIHNANAFQARVLLVKVSYTDLPSPQLPHLI